MKYLFTVLLVLVAGFASAQIINIPDSAFKAALISRGFDTNNDGEIQQSEADTVTVLDINSLRLKDITGIRSFTNLKILDCSGNDLTNFDISNHPSIESINIADNSFNYFFNLNDTGLVSFNAANCTRLKSVNLSNQTSGISYYSSVAINLINCDSLTTLDLNTCPVSTLDISGCSSLTHLGIWQMGSLVARNCTALVTIIPNLSMTGGIGTADVTGCTNLEYLSFGEAGLVQHVDLSTCPNIKTLFIPYTSADALYLNVKNGTRLIDCKIGIIPRSGTLPAILNICADDFEIDSFRTWLQYVNMRNDPLTNINSYCSFYPGGSYNTIKGKLRIDDENNGCNNSGRLLSYVPLRFTDTTGQYAITYSNIEGDYTAFTYKGLFSFSPYFPYPFFIFTPTNPVVSFDTANSLINTTDFCLQPTGIHDDLEITLLPASAARPGFDAVYNLSYRNKGTTTLSGAVSINFDYNKINFIAASQNAVTQNSGQVTWNYNNLRPFEGGSISVTFNLLPPPVNNIGDTISYLAVITPSANDETAFDNIFILPQMVIGSFDPNDKTCIEGSKIDIAKIGDYLHYQIRFQNEGTDTAFNIVVADTLSDKLDWNTFEFIGSSHACDPQLKNNKAAFFFENINLPYKAINEPASNGWVAFKIKPKPSVVIGDSLNNSAAIYFDFNFPVITNTATTIVSSSSTPVPVKLEYFSVNRKENNNQLNWKASCTYGNAGFVIERSEDGILFKAIGNINATALRCQLPFNFTDNNPVAGKNYYRLKITDAEGKSFYSKTLVVGNNKAGIEITAVANNTVYITSNKQQIITMKVIAADGREIFNQKRTVIAGNNNINMLMKNTAKGIYTLIVFTEEGETINKRFLK